MNDFPEASQIGLISDTHGLLREEAVKALRGSHLILHAGDVGDPRILATLRTIAPVVAIRGNIDTDPYAKDWPDTTIVSAADGLQFYMLHDVKSLDLSPEGTGFSVVLSGHSHKPVQAYRRGVFYINPGSAGPRRFKRPIPVARLDMNVRPYHAEIISLE